MKAFPLDPAAWLAAVVESSDDAIVSKTLDGTITSWNRSAERLYGYSAEEAIGRSILLIVPPEREHEEHRLLAALANGERVDHFETERRTKDGRLVAVSLTISPVRDPSGVIVGASKIARDISERRAVESTLREANRRKDEFLAMLGHELRNPLAPILTAVELLGLKSAAHADLMPICGVLQRQVTHMVRLLDDLLDVGRISSGKIQLRAELLDLRTVIARAVEAARPLIDEHAHTLSLSTPGGAVWVRGDATRLVQMLVNLVHNACKYTPAGGTITISAAATPGGEAQIIVRDSGVGMKPELVRDVFELFVQGERTLDRARGGLGIGLTLVRSIAHLHGGNVEARSEGEGMGSTFIVTLPTEVEAPATRAVESPTLASIPGGRHVVVVDDNVDGAIMLAEIAKWMNHTATVVHDSQIALTVIRREQPDVAFVDIGLPGMDGLALARTLRDSGYHGLLVAVTGYGQPQDMIRSRAAGFNHHWVKPVDPVTLQRFFAQMDARPA